MSDSPYVVVEEISLTWSRAIYLVSRSQVVDSFCIKLCRLNVKNELRLLGKIQSVVHLHSGLLTDAL